MRRTKEEAEITRQQLLDTALRMFGEKGYEATRLADIAAESGVTRGAIYWHFKNKDDLVISMIKEKSEDIYQIVESELNQEGKASDKIVNIFKRVAKKMLEDKSFHAFGLLSNYYYTQPEIFDQLLKFHENRQCYFSELLKTLIEKAQKQNEINRDFSPHDIMMMMMCLIEGIINLAQEKKMGFSVDDLNVDNLASIFQAALTP